VDQVRGQVTNPVAGTLTVGEALDRLLAGTKLRVSHDSKTGAFAVLPQVPVRQSATGGNPGDPPPGRGRLANLLRSIVPSRSADPAPSGPGDAGSRASPISLNPFDVVNTRDNGFQITTVGTASRLSLDLANAPIAYSVVNREMIEALGIRDVQEAA